MKEKMQKGQKGTEVTQGTQTTRTKNGHPGENMEAKGRVPEIELIKQEANHKTQANWVKTHGTGGKVEKEKGRGSKDKDSGLQHW